MPTPLVNDVLRPTVPGTGCGIKFYQGTPFLYLNHTSYEMQAFLTGVELRAGGRDGLLTVTSTAQTASSSHFLRVVH